MCHHEIGLGHFSGPHNTYHTELCNCLFSLLAVHSAGKGRLKQEDQCAGCCRRRDDEGTNNSRDNEGLDNRQLIGAHGLGEI